MTKSTPMAQPVFRTAFWVMITGAAQGVKLVISITATIVLARLLAPDDFGLVATAAPIIGFVELIRDAGFSQAFVQRAEVTEEQGHALFWTTLAITAVLALLVIALSPLAAAFFHEPRLAGVLVASAGIMMIGSLGSQASAWMTRRLRFKLLSAIDVASSAINLVIAVLFAVLLDNYWAIIVGGAAAALANVGLTLFLGGWRPGRPRFDRAVLQMARFGAGVSFTNVMNYISRSADNLLIARYYGSVPLGYYDRAYRLMLMPLTQITWPISRVLTPVLSRLQDDAVEYRKLYLTTITFIMMATQPALIAATVFAEPTILFLLGEKWSPAIPIFQWLSAAAVHQVVTSSLGWLFLSQGRVRQFAITGTFGSITTVGAFVVGLPWGAVGVAAAYTISDYLLRLPFAWLYVGREGPVRTSALLRSVAPHVLSILATSLALVTYQNVMEPSGFWGLVAGTLLAYASYMAMICLFAEKRRILRMGFTKVMTKLSKR